MRTPGEMNKTHSRMQGEPQTTNCEFLFATQHIVHSRIIFKKRRAVFSY